MTWLVPYTTSSEKEEAHGTSRAEWSRVRYQRKRYRTGEMRLRHIVDLPGRYARLSSANKRPRFRLERLEPLDRDRLDDRFVLFLLVLEFVRVCERPPKRFHARIVVFVTHGRAFAATYSTSIQNGSTFRRPHRASETIATLARFPLYRR